MTTITKSKQDEDISLYLKLCGDVYGESKPSYFDNNIPEGWIQLNLASRLGFNPTKATITKWKNVA